MAGFISSASPENGRSVSSGLSPNRGHVWSGSRSPHPYHRRGTSLHCIKVGTNDEQRPSDQNKGQSISHSSAESGTEADDERGRFLKGLPAPPLRPHKGLRNPACEDPTPWPSPFGSLPDEENNEKQLYIQGDGVFESPTIREKYRKRKFTEATRKLTETVLFVTVGLVVSYSHLSGGSLLAFGPAILCHFAVIMFVYLLHPSSTAYQAKQAGSTLSLSIRRSFRIPSRFDPAPLLYPAFLPLLVAISIMPASLDFILPNIVLGVSSLPRPAAPFPFSYADFNLFHWLLTMLPLSVLGLQSQLCVEMMTLLYPLHVCTLRIIEFLSTTSLDPVERNLLAAALIDLYIFADSPQSEILKALLWYGTMLVLVFCQRPLQWEVCLARIPSWRFRESIRRPHSSISLFTSIDRKFCNAIARLLMRHGQSHTGDSEDELDFQPSFKKHQTARELSFSLDGLFKQPRTHVLDQSSATVIEPNVGDQGLESCDYSTFHHGFTNQCANPSTAIDNLGIPDRRTTPSGRRKRSVTHGSQSFLAFTPAQVAVRKRAYAVFVYAAVVFIILGPIRIYVSLFSLQQSEPAGWALGYLLGNVSRFQSLVSSTGLDRWIRLPIPSDQFILAQLGWVERLRQNILGPANMRLLICAYCLLVLLAGMATVLNLSSIAEVDTRRKVFHGMMVVMLLPTVFIDPCFIALALALILAIFLLLDLFRASQLPPISKPLTAFLSPYVDGRDYRGPVIVSHIFLLIGCAMPLWLSLAAVPRTGSGPWAGWDVDSRDVSMVSGIVCVGMGDSAASLVGRRYGRHKWHWGGGKSLEGSLAFAAAVTVGLFAAYLWLRVGGWIPYEWETVVTVWGKVWLAGLGASLTEAVLTGANDNVVVPVVLWLLVRAFRL